MYAWDGGAWKKIVFQVDERMEVSAYATWTLRERFLSYAFDTGPKAGPDPDPGFDADDELVFMASSSGARAGEGAGPAGAVACEEIELVDPVSGDESYAYACTVSSPGPVSDVKYVTLKSDDEIHASGYVAEYPAGNPINFHRFQARGPSGLSPDVVDRMKMQVMVGVIMGVANYPLTENDFQHYVRGVRSGPVRVIKEFESVLETWAAAQIRTYNHVYFYPFHIEYDVLARGAANWGKTINTSDLVLAVDLNDRARGMTFYSEKNPRGETIDGKSNPSELNMDYGPTEWAAVGGNRAGAIVLHMGLDIRTPLYKDLYYADNDDKGDPPEEEPGMVGKFGYVIHDMQKAGFDKFPVRFSVYGSPDDYRPGMERELVDLYKNPLTVKINNHELKAVWPDAPAVADTREKPPKSSFAEQESAFEISQFFSPGFIFDPNLLGNGPGGSWIDIDFLGTGTFFAVGAFFTDRGLADYSVEFSELRFIKGVESFRVRLSNASFPAEPYFGIGNDSEKDDKVLYWWRKDKVDLTFKKYFANIYGADFRVGYKRISIHPGIEPRGGEDLPSLEERYGLDHELIGPRWGPPVYGRQGGNLNSFTVNLYRDMREARNLPKFGNYQGIEAYVVTSALGSDYDYTIAKLDLRSYWHPDFLNPIPLLDDMLNPRRTLVSKFIGPDKRRAFASRLVFTKSFAEEIEWYGQEILDVPFYELPYLGSSSTLKAWSSKRFRDNDNVLASLEYRWRWWKFQDMALYCDTGMVMNDILEKEAWEQDWRLGYGFSWRIHVPPHIIVTFEYGWSEEEAMYLNQMNWAF
jgi:hypothetical protein